MCVIYDDLRLMWCLWFLPALDDVDINNRWILIAHLSTTSCYRGDNNWRQLYAYSQNASYTVTLSVIEQKWNRCSSAWIVAKESFVLEYLEKFSITRRSVHSLGFSSTRRLASATVLRWEDEGRFFSESQMGHLRLPSISWILHSSIWARSLSEQLRDTENKPNILFDLFWNMPLKRFLPRAETRLLPWGAFRSRWSCRSDLERGRGMRISKNLR